MIKKVLFVDDDRILCRLIQKKLEKYADTFSVLTAEDGLDAVNKLKENTISLVVTDLQMPRMDGFALLAHLSENYPDISVIVQTGHSTPKSKKYALDRGATGYIEKPFKVEKLAEKVIATLQRESEGGILQTIPLEMFIQLIEMERKTCTIRVLNKSSQDQGVLFFRGGDLLDARMSANHGKPAAYEIFSWDEVTLSIQDDCPIKEKKIDGDLQAILFDAMRLKDESGEDPEAFSEDIPVDHDFEDVEADIQEPEALSLQEALQHKLENYAGDKSSLYDIYRDNSWNDLLVQAAEIGIFWKAGLLKFCYIDKGESTGFILVPGKETTVIAVDPKFPRDRLLEALSR